MTALIICGVLLLVFLVMLGLGLRAQIMYMLNRPIRWYLNSLAPRFSQQALALIYENRPDKTKTFRWGGRMTFVPGVIQIASNPKGAGGLVDDINIPKFTCALGDPYGNVFDRFWKTAGIHEPGHYIWMQTYGNMGDDEKGNPRPEFSIWIEKVRTIVKEAEDRFLLENP